MIKTLVGTLLILSAVETASRAQAQDLTTILIDGKRASAHGILTRLKQPGDLQKQKASDQTLTTKSLRKSPAFDKGQLPAGLMVVQKMSGKQAVAMTSAEVQQNIQDLMATGLYEYAEPDWILTATEVPTDTAFTDGRLWGLKNTGQDGGTAGVDINVEPAWALAQGSSEVIVAVIDTGIRYTHTDLAANMWRNTGELAGNGHDDDGNGYVDDVFGINAIKRTGNPMDDSGHGTHCAGTIAAAGNNAGEHVGVAWRTRLMALKFLDTSGSGANSDAIACINYAVAKGARILSCSWGGGENSTALQEAMDNARKSNVLIVAAAGNYSEDADSFPHFPAAYNLRNIVSVAAVDRAGKLADFSNYGQTSVDIGAPGVDIFSCGHTSDTAYRTANGTSMATPHVAGVAALILCQHPTASYGEIKTRLLQAARPLPSLAGITRTGGIVDAHAALTLDTQGEWLFDAIPTPTLAAGETSDIYLEISRPAPVTGLTVTASLGGGLPVIFRDNGQAPDLHSGDGIYSATMVAPSNAPTVQLEVTATGGNPSPVITSIPMPVIQPPVNDAIANRIVLTAGSTQTVGTNRRATVEAGESINPAVAGTRSVWWEWVSGVTGTVYITTAGSSFDTTMAVYRSTSPPDLRNMALVGANDDDNPYAYVNTSGMKFKVEAGTSYYIQVNGFQGAQGKIVLNYPSPFSATSPPVIAAQPASIVLATGEALNLSVTAYGASPLSYQWRKNNVNIPGATEAEYHVGAVQPSDDASYSVRVTNPFGTITSAVARVTVDTVSTRPGNDAFAQAVVITGTSGETRGSNALSSGETGEPDHAQASSPVESVWYRWTAPGNGTLTMDTYGSGFDTTLAAYRGTAVEALSLLAADNNNSGRQSFLRAPVLAGQVISIAVDGAGTAEGSFILHHHFQPAAAGLTNDHFANRTVISGLTKTLTASNAGATGEPGEPLHSTGSEPVESVWWSWTAPVSGVATVDTRGSAFDTTLAVYQSAGTLAELVLAGQNDDFAGTHSLVAFDCIAGRTYVIAVDGKGTAEGAIQLNLNAGQTAPEIAITSPQGQALESGASTVNYGAVPYNTYIPADFGLTTYTISNQGMSNLTGLSVRLEGPGAAAFVIGTAPGARLGPGQTTPFVVRFLPGAAVTYSATIVVSSNDAATPEFRIPVTGLGVAPRRELDVEYPVGQPLFKGGAGVSFNLVKVGTSQTLPILLRNTGTTELRIYSSSIVAGGSASFSPQPGSTNAVFIPPGGTALCTPRFTPASAGTHQAVLRLSSDDADEAVFDIPLHGIGVQGTQKSLTINATDRGWYSSTGYHSPSHTGIRTGRSYYLASAMAHTRSFFVFDLPDLGPDEVITSASLRIVNAAAGYDSTYSEETLALWQVTTPTDTLLSGFGGKAAFQDLADGLRLAESAQISPYTGMGDIPLNAELIRQAQTQDRVVIGGSLSSVESARTANVFGGVGTDMNQTQLVLTTTQHYPAAEIVVEQAAAQPLLDGQSLAHFGWVSAGASTDKVFTIRNLGAAALTGIAVTLDGVNASEYSLVTPPATSVPAGGSTTFTVRFATSAIEERTAALHISSNDVDEPSFDIALAGRGMTTPDDLTFKIQSIATTGMRLNGYPLQIGSVKEGMVASASKVFMAASDKTGVMNLPDLGSLLPVLRASKGMCSDLRSGRIFYLANNGVEMQAGGSINQLVELDPETAQPSGAVIPLSQSITLAQTGVGIFSGSGRIVIYSGTATFDVKVPSGQVTPLANTNLSFSPAYLSWVKWGIAEYFEGSLHLTYTSGTQIQRKRLSDGTVQTLANFGTISMEGWTVAPHLGRWYFCYSASVWTSAFRSTWAVGYADAVFQTGPATAPPDLAQPRMLKTYAGRSFNHKLTAQNGPVTFSCTNLPAGVTLDAATGVLAGSIASAGIHPLTIQVTNAAGTSEATLTVESLPRPTMILDDFDPAAESHLWAESGGQLSINRTAAPSKSNPTENNLHFDGSGTRFLTTQPVDTRQNAYLSFKFAAGNGDYGERLWESLDSMRGVMVEYSTDGTTFTTLSGPYTSTTWTTVTYALPEAARTESTQIRWRQLQNSTSGYDQWALDDVYIGPSNYVSPGVTAEINEGWPEVTRRGSFDYGTVMLGSSNSRILYIRGAANLSALQFIFEGPDAADFSAATPTDYGGNYDYTFIKFTPQGPGLRRATMRMVVPNQPGSAFELDLSGTGLAPQPDISLDYNGSAWTSGQILYLTSVEPGQEVLYTLTVRNLGTAEMTGIYPALRGAHAADYSILTPPLTSLAPNASSTFVVRFAPSQSGTRNALLELASDDPDEDPFQVTLQAYGATPSPRFEFADPSGTVLASRSTFNFGVQPITTQVPQVFTVRNPGTAPLPITAVSISGGDVTDFVIVQNLPASIPANSSAELVVQFKPTADGARQSTLIIEHTGYWVSDFELKLQGTGRAYKGRVSVFANGEFVDGTAFGEPEAVCMTLRDQGYVPVKFSGVQTADWVAAFENDGVIIPRLIYATPLLPAEAIPLIQEKLATGHGLVVMGADGNLEETFLNGLSGWALTDGGQYTTGMVYRSAGNVLRYPNRPDTVPVLSVTHRVSTASLPARAEMWYGEGAFIAGPVAYLGYDMRMGASPNWTTVLVRMLEATSAFASKPMIRIENTAGKMQFGSLNMGVYPLGAVGTAELKISNVGGAPLTGLTMSAPQDPAFSCTALSTTTLPPGESTTVTFTFDTAVYGGHYSTVLISSNDPHYNPIDCPLVAGMYKTPEIDVLNAAGASLETGGSLHLGTAAMGSVIETEITVTNIGEPLMVLHQPTLSGADAVNFTVSTLPTPSVDIAGGRYRRLKVRFLPSEAREQTAVLHIPSTDWNEPSFDITLGGIGVPESRAEIHVLSGEGLPLADNAGVISFGGLETGRSAVHQIMVRNIGGSDLTKLALSKTGPGSADFTISPLPSTTLGPDGGIPLMISFMPGVTGQRQCTLKIASNDTDESPYEIALNGTGLSPEVAVETAQGALLADGRGTLAFGTDLSAGSDHTRTLTVRNTGSTDLRLISSTLDGVNADRFAVTMPQGSIVPAGGSAAVMITFTADTSGVYKAGFHLFSSDVDESVYDIALTAEIAEPEIGVEVTPGASLTSQQGTLAFDLVQNGQSAERVLIIKNTGSRPLENLVLSFSGPDAASFSQAAPLPGSVATKGSTRAPVRFSPTTSGEHQATLSITSNDFDENPFVITLTGRGASELKPEIIAQPQSRIVAAGTPVTFTAGTNVKSKVTYQWQRGTTTWSNIAGATGASLTLPAVKPTDGLTNYRVLVKNSAGSAESTPATLTVVDMTSRELVQALPASVTLTARVTSTETLVCRWFKDGALLVLDPPRLSNGTPGQLLLQEAAATDSGIYTCEITSSAGTMMGGEEILTAYDGPPQHSSLSDLPYGRVGHRYSYFIPHSDSGGPVFEYAASRLPPGLRVNTRTGEIYGVPTKSNSYYPEITLKNDLGSHRAYPRLWIGTDTIAEQIQGDYQGMMERGAVDQNLGGRLDLKVTTAGSYSGKLQLGAVTYPFSGGKSNIMAAQNSGVIRHALPRASLPPLELELTLGNGQLSGTLGSASQETSVITCWRRWTPSAKVLTTVTFSLTKPAPLAGRSDIPQGFGFGSARVDLGGSAFTMTGRMPDGDSFTCSAFRGGQNSVALYSSLASRGTLAGTLLMPQIRSDITSSNDIKINCTATWSRPAAAAPARANLYPQGFEPVPLIVSGGRYLAPLPVKISEQIVLNKRLPATPGNGRLNFTEAGIEDSATIVNRLVTLTPGNLVLNYPASAFSPTSLKIDPVTGMFSGGFTLVDSHPYIPGAARITRRATFQGILITPLEPQPMVGHGYFLLQQLPGPPSHVPVAPQVLSGAVILD